MLEREEYVELAYLFRVLRERMQERTPLQELLEFVREEVLATTKLPMAIDFMLSELKHHGMVHTAMAKLAHYFPPFQTYLMSEAERDTGRFAVETAIQILERECQYRAESPKPEGLFFYQFESLCRNRLRYDPGLEAMAKDPCYNDDWRDWILTVRRQIGLVDLADMVFVRSAYYPTVAEQRGWEHDSSIPVLFGVKEGRIALANRRKDPLYLFAALQRHLSYPRVPKPPRHDPTPELIPQMLRRLERLETRLKMLEEEQREGAVDLARFYRRPDSPPKPPE